MQARLYMCTYMYLHTRTYVGIHMLWMFVGRCHASTNSLHLCVFVDVLSAHTGL